MLLYGCVVFANCTSKKRVMWIAHLMRNVWLHIEISDFWWHISVMFKSRAQFETFFGTLPFQQNLHWLYLIAGGETIKTLKRSHLWFLFPAGNFNSPKRLFWSKMSHFFVRRLHFILPHHSEVFIEHNLLHIEWKTCWNLLAGRFLCVSPGKSLFWILLQSCWAH